MNHDQLEATSSHTFFTNIFTEERTDHLFTFLVSILVSLWSVKEKKGKVLGLGTKRFSFSAISKRVSYQQHIDVLEDGKWQLANLTNKGHAGTLLFLTLFGEDLMFHSDYTSLLKILQGQRGFIGTCFSIS